MQHPDWTPCVCLGALPQERSTWRQDSHGLGSYAGWASGVSADLSAALELHVRSGRKTPIWASLAALSSMDRPYPVCLSISVT